MKSERWESKIPEWDLEAQPNHIQEKQAIVLVNGKPTEFVDVEDNPAIYIGRSNEHYDLSESDLHNPYSVDDHGRLEACLKYVDHLIEQVQEDQRFRERLWTLHGRPVACWCVPDLCHGDVIGLFLAYRLHTDWGLQRIGDEIKNRMQNHVQRGIERGNLDPSKYQNTEA